jgi:hypothetical protein
MIRGIALLTAAALLGGCASGPPTLYHWGNYEELIYASYAAPGKMPLEAEVEKMEQDRQQALAAQQRLPPGWHAHLGLLYYQIGKADQALQELQSEKAEFPESTVFIDRLVANISR